jgi:hypothetical protein
MCLTDRVLPQLGRDADVKPGVAMIPVELVPFVRQSDAARLVFELSVGAFVVNEFSQALRVRRGATRSNLGAFVNGNICAGLFGSSIGRRLVDEAGHAQLAAVARTGPFRPR